MTPDLRPIVITIARHHLTRAPIKRSRVDGQPVDGRVSIADTVTAALDGVLEVPAVVLASAARDHRAKVVTAHRALRRSLEDTAGIGPQVDEGCAHQKDLSLGPNTLRARHEQP